MAVDSKKAGIALVTGASRRIGKAIAQRLAQENYDLILHSSLRSEPETQALATSLRQGRTDIAVVTADLANAEAVSRILPQAAALLGPVSLLVNNASLFEPDLAQSVETSLFDRHMAVNLRAPVMLARDFAAQLPQDEHGCIINIIDQRVWRLNPTFFSYTLSKSALWTATRTMAQAFAPRIRVNGVGPGPTLANHLHGAEGFAAEAAAIPLGLAIDPDEIAQAVAFLVQARSVTGQMIAVDGGQHLAWQTPDVMV